MSILIKPAYDTDASAYFSTAGVTSTAGRQQISRFVTGIKDLGLWSNMACWPLRSSQNAGTGTTAYSLGGLGTFNGTLTNGPTWTSNGIDFDGSNDFISTGLGNVYSSGISILVGFNPDNIAVDDFTAIISNQQTNPPYPTFDIRRISGSTINASVTIDGTERALTLGDVMNGNSYFAGFSHNNATARSFFNGSQIQFGSFSGSVSTSVNNLNIGRNPAFSRNFDGKIFFSLAATDGITDSQYLSIYSLYKTTLGQGLGLP